MKTITLTEQEIREAVEDAETIQEEGGKHDCTNTQFLFEREGKHYTIWVSCSYNDGLQIYGPQKATEVHQVEKTVKVWEPVE